MLRTIVVAAVIAVAGIVTVLVLLAAEARSLGSDIPRPLTLGDDQASQVAVTQRPVSERQGPDGLAVGLQKAFASAEAAAGRAGHSLVINSGYRTPEHQLRLLDEAIQKHGSKDVALRWVFPPERSMHVRGLAIDVGDGPAADWLEQNGAAFGLCRTLAWEWWHFEWRAQWQDAQRCPGPVDDPADAPS